MRSDESVKAAARRLRQEMTPPEVRLWLRLRQASQGSPRFRRQHPLGPYVLDFYCPAARLCVEVDGWRHNLGDQPGRGEQRDAWLAARGVETHRIAASEVLNDPDEAAWSVIQIALERITPPRRLRRHLPRYVG